MARKLINLKLHEVSLVDSPANVGATVLLYKRSDIEKKIVERDGQYCVTTADGSKTLGCHKTMAAAQRQLAAIEANKIEKGTAMKCPSCEKRLPVDYADNGMEMPNYCPECGAKLMLMAEGGDTTLQKKEIKKMDFTKDSLTPEGKAFVENLEKRLADAETKLAEATKPKTNEPEDIWKGVSPEVRKMVEDANKRAADAETVAMVERSARELQEFEKRAEKEFPHIPGELKTKASILKAINSKLTKEEAAEAERMLKAADELARTAGIFSEAGVSGEGSVSDSALAEIQKRAGELVKAGTVKSLEEGVSKIAAENPDLYRQYRREVSSSKTN